MREKTVILVVALIGIAIGLAMLPTDKDARKLLEANGYKPIEVESCIMCCWMVKSGWKFKFKALKDGKEVEGHICADPWSPDIEENGK